MHGHLNVKAGKFNSTIWSITNTVIPRSNVVTGWGIGDLSPDDVIGDTLSSA